MSFLMKIEILVFSFYCAGVQFVTSKSPGEERAVSLCVRELGCTYYLSFPSHGPLRDKNQDKNATGRRWGLRNTGRAPYVTPV